MPNEVKIKITADTRDAARAVQDFSTTTERSLLRVREAIDALNARAKTLVFSPRAILEGTEQTRLGLGKADEAAKRTMASFRSLTTAADGAGGSLRSLTAPITTLAANFNALAREANAAALGLDRIRQAGPVTGTLLNIGTEAGEAAKGISALSRTTGNLLPRLAELQGAKFDGLRIADGANVAAGALANLREKTAAASRMANPFSSNASSGGRSLMQRGTALSAVGSGLQSAGQAATWGYSAPVAGAAAFAVKTAVSREDQFADVEKVYSKETPEKIAQVRKELTALSDELGITFRAVTALASQGGQLGVPIESLKEYTKVAAQLGMVTDLSADQATTGLAKIAAAMGLNISTGPEAGKTFHDLAEQLAQMGLMGSATGSEIVRTAERIASAGKNAGMTTGDVLALSNGLTSLGQRAEASGTAAMRTLTQMSVAVATNNKQLASFASVSGMTTEQFKAAFNQDALGTILRFTSGLDELQRHGKATVGILSEMGIKNTSQLTALTNLSHAQALVTQYRQANIDALQKQNVLEDAAAKKAGDTAHQFQALVNKTEEVAAKLGDSLIPVLTKLEPDMEKLLGAASHMIDDFDKLSPPLKEAALELLAVSVAAGPVVSTMGSVFSMVGSVTRGIGAFKALRAGESVREVTMALTGMGEAATVAGAAESAAAAEGAAAFAVGMPWMAAIAAATLAIGGLVAAWQEAAKKQADYYNATHTNNPLTDIGADVAQRQKELADLQNKGGFHSAKASPQDIAAAQQRLSDAQQYQQNIQSGNTGYFDAKIADYKAQLAPVLARQQAAAGVRGKGAGRDRDADEQATRLEAIIARFEEYRQGAAQVGNSPMGQAGGAGKAPAWESLNAANDAAGRVTAQFGNLTDHCGDFVTALVRASGASKTFTATAGAANAALRIRPDAQGNYPAGTIFHLGAGGKGTTRHYATTYDGHHLLEDLTTSSGKNGARSGRVSWNRTVDEIKPRILSAYLPTAAAAQAWNSGHAAPAPDGLPGNPASASFTPDDKTADDRAQDHAEALVEKADAGVDAARAALDHCKAEYARTKDPYFLVLARAALAKLTRARMAQAQATLAKAQTEAHKKGTSDEAGKAAYARASSTIGREASTEGQSLSDIMGGTPAERQKRLSDAAIARQQGRVQQTDASIGEYRRLLDKGVLSDYAPLKAALDAKEQQEKDLAGMQYRSGLRDNPLDQGRLSADRDNAVQQAHNARLRAGVELEQEYSAAVAKGLDLKLKQLQADRALLDIAAQTAKTDAAKTAAASALFENTKQQLQVQRQKDNLSEDANTQAMAGTNYTIGIQAAQAQNTQTGKDVDSGARERRLQFLRAEIEATDDLALKAGALAEAHRLEAQAAAEAGNAEAVAMQRMQATREDADLLIEQTRRQAEGKLTSVLLDPSAARKTSSKGPLASDAGQALSGYESLTAQGTLEQQKAAVTSYLSVLDSLFRAHMVARKEVLADVERLSAEWEKAGILTPESAGQAHTLKSEAEKHWSLGSGMGGTEFWTGMAQEAGNASGNIVHNMLHPKNRGSMFKQFFTDMASIGENSLAGAFSNVITGSLTHGIGDLTHGVGGLFGGLKGGRHKAVTDAAASVLGKGKGGATPVYLVNGPGGVLGKGGLPGGVSMPGGVLAAISASSKAGSALTSLGGFPGIAGHFLDIFHGKAKSGLPGGILGKTGLPGVPAGVTPVFIVGSGAGAGTGGRTGIMDVLSLGANFLPGGGLAGGILKKLFHFADGGLPPINIPSLVGERGPEFFLPTVPGAVLPQGIVKQITGGGQGPMLDVLRSIEAKVSGSGDTNITMNAENHNHTPAVAEANTRAMGRELENMLRRS